MIMHEESNDDSKLEEVRSLVESLGKVMGLEESCDGECRIT